MEEKINHLEDTFKQTAGDLKKQVDQLLRYLVIFASITVFLFIIVFGAIDLSLQEVKETERSNIVMIEKLDSIQNTIIRLEYQTGQNEARFFDVISEVYDYVKENNK